MPREQTGSDRSANAAGTEFFNTLQEMSCEWMERVSTEVELALKLSKNLNAAHSISDAIVAYQEWLNEELSACAENARRVVSNGQKFMAANSRLLSNGWTSAGTTT